MPEALTESEKAQLEQTIEMFEVITQSQPQDYQSLEILKEAYLKLGRESDVNGTSRRIAEAYVQLGQLSSAILEYESILQRNPEDSEAQKALEEIENRATSFAPVEDEAVEEPTAPGAPALAQGDDGRKVMEKLFVDGKMISDRDFENCWPQAPAGDPGEVLPAFIQTLADKGLVQLEESMPLLAEKSRAGYIPIERYDVDVEMARSAPGETCRRWCVLPIDRMSKAIFVATANPFNKQAAAELENAFGNRVIWYLTSPTELATVIKKLVR